MKLLINILIYIIIGVIPLIVFLELYNRYEKKYSKSIFIILAYMGCIILVPSTMMNFFPFILVILSIGYIKKYSNISREDFCINNNKSNDSSNNKKVDINIIDDYKKYNFNIKSLKFFQGIKYSIYTYGTIITVAIIYMYILQQLNIDLKQQEVISEMMNSPLRKFLLIVPSAVIFAPIVEEFVFRWVLFEKILSKRINIYYSAIISSTIFALVHYNIKAFASILVIAIVNCYLIHKKGYWYAVLNHVIFNSVSTMAILIQKFI